MEVAEAQQKIFDLQTEIESLRDERRNIGIEQNKLERTTKLRKALAIDKHQQKVCIVLGIKLCYSDIPFNTSIFCKISQMDEVIEDIVDVLYDYEEQLEK